MCGGPIVMWFVSPRRGFGNRGGARLALEGSNETNLQVRNHDHRSDAAAIGQRPASRRPRSRRAHLTRQPAERQRRADRPARRHRSQGLPGSEPQHEDDRQRRRQHHHAAARQGRRLRPDADEVEARIKSLLEAKYINKADVSVRCSKTAASRSPSSARSFIRAASASPATSRLIRPSPRPAAWRAATARTLYVLRTASNGLTEQIAIDIEDLMVNGNPDLNLPLRRTT